MEKHLREQEQEKAHLAQCLEIIQENIRLYEDKESRYKKEVTELFQAVKKGEGDSYGMLIAGRNILEHTQNSLRKNRAAFQKAYFGRVDYQDETYGVSESLYIGKNGITQNSNDVIIVDWRAPVSSVYYENELGRGIMMCLEANQWKLRYIKREPMTSRERICWVFMMMM